MAKPKKYRWLRRLLRIFIILCGLFIIACLVFDHYVQFRKSDKELSQIFNERNLDARIHYYETNGRKLRYVESGNDSLPALLMLHGSPGSMSYYSRRFSDSLIRPRFKIFAVDRPGYGYSGFGDPEPSVQKQAQMIRRANILEPPRQTPTPRSVFQEPRRFYLPQEKDLLSIVDNKIKSWK